jgi:hypothetical protein
MISVSESVCRVSGSEHLLCQPWVDSSYFIGIQPGTPLGARDGIDSFAVRVFGNDVVFGICSIHIVNHSGGSQSDGVCSTYKRGGTDEENPFREAYRRYRESSWRLIHRLSFE